MYEQPIPDFLNSHMEWRFGLYYLLTGGKKRGKLRGKAASALLRNCPRLFLVRMPSCVKNLAHLNLVNLYRADGILNICASPKTLR